MKNIQMVICHQTHHTQLSDLWKDPTHLKMNTVIVRMMTMMKNTTIDTIWWMVMVPWREENTVTHCACSVSVS